MRWDKAVGSTQNISNPSLCRAIRRPAIVFVSRGTPLRALVRLPLREDSLVLWIVENLLLSSRTEPGSLGIKCRSLQTAYKRPGGHLRRNRVPARDNTN